jgi:hypothetical protein
VVNLATALNRASVPPPQFVEVVRYAPVAIVDTTYDPPFVTYVTTRVDQGLVGDALVADIQERYRPYGVAEFDYAAPRYLVVEGGPVLPPLVVNRFGLDPVDYVAMPLAVAAVAELTDVPMNDLQVYLCPEGYGEAVGTINALGRDIHVLIRGTLDLSGDQTRIDVQKIEAGNLPGGVGTHRNRS